MSRNNKTRRNNYLRSALQYMHMGRHYDFIGRERDLEMHILENIHDIAAECGWGEICKVKQQFTVRLVGYHIVIDIMLWHPDGSGTLIECKTNNTNRNDLLTGIGQVLFYGTNLPLRLGTMPRLVIASPVISPFVRATIKEFGLPISLLGVDGDRCTYLS